MNIRRSEVRDMNETEIEDHTQLSSGSMEDLRDSSDKNTRPEKRTRDVDEEEIWTHVTKSGKRRIREGINSTREISENKIEVCITCKDILPKQFALARLLKAENIKNISRVKYVNPYKVLITLDSEEDASQLCLNTAFKNKGWKCQKTLEVGLSYGVLRDCEEDLEDKEILESLSSPIADIIAIKRLNYRNLDGKWVPSQCIRVCFKGSTLPAFVYIHGIKTKVDQFKFPVTQCSKCWRFGHSGKLCPSRKLTCPKCSENHANCESQVYKCANCGGQHMALFKGCPMYLKEKRVREIMSEFNCTYKMAINMYVQASPRASPIRDTQNTYSFNTNPRTYAAVVNTPIPAQEQPESNKSPNKRHSKNVNKYPKITIRTEREWENISMETKSTASDRHVTNECNEKEKKTNCNLIQRLQEILFMKKCNMETKIKTILQIIGEWILSYVVKNIKDLKIFKTFFDG